MSSSRFSTLSRTQKTLTFVPSFAKPSDADVKKLQAFVERSKKLYVITGAGISTESGLPDYRSEEVGLYARSSSRPLQYQEFLRSAEARQRYWARNFAGWQRFSSVEPNLTHKILSDWEKVGKVFWLVTQNVDALHRKALSTRYTELHGCAHEVECLSCNQLYEREAIQQKMQAENPDFEEEALTVSPDGDVFIPDEKVVNFWAPLCDSCGGVLKPRVVFFGDNVRKDVVTETQTKLTQSDALLSIGSSLQTYSSYRLLLQASKEGKSIFIVNIGPTRADHLAGEKVQTLASLLLSQIDVSSKSV